MHSTPSGQEAPSFSSWLIASNHQFIACNKPAGLPVQPDKTTDTSLLALAAAYCRQPLDIVNRIDRPVSGLVLFAKKKSSVAFLNQQFQDRGVEKSYLAIVGNMPPATSDDVVHYLRNNGATNRTRIADTAFPGALEARLQYQYIGSSDRYHLLLVKLLTGRHHQIRAQLAQLGCPVRGDVKYGFKRANADRSIDLHSWQLGFRRPVTNEWQLLTAPPPVTPVWQAFADKIAGL